MLERTGRTSDMLERGVVGPAKVTRLALQDAASVAGLFLPTDAMVAEAEKEKRAQDENKRTIPAASEP